MIESTALFMRLTVPVIYKTAYLSLIAIWPVSLTPVIIYKLRLFND